MAGHRRTLPIDLALEWAIGDEMLKLGEGWGGTGRYAPGFNPSALAGYSGTTFYLSDPIPVSPGDPHPDALTINGMVQGLMSVTLDASISAEALAPECAGMIRAGDQILSNLVVNVAALVLMHAKMRTRPTWEVEWSVGAQMRDNGVPLVVGTRVPHRPLYSAGAHCPLDIHPDPRELVSDRAEYLCWWTALCDLAAGLAGRLVSLDVTAPEAPPRPWIDAPVKPTILRDLTKDWTTKAVPRAPGRKMHRGNAALA